MTDYSHFQSDSGFIHQGMLVKRSRHATFGREQFKKRNFLLTDTKLYYFEGPDLKSCKLGEQLSLKTFRAIEEADGSVLARQFMFQIVYDEASAKGSASVTKTLYLVAPTMDEMNQWIEILRTTCSLRHNVTSKHTYYHPAPSVKGSYSCCSSNDTRGCKKCFNWPTDHSLVCTPTGSGATTPVSADAPPNPFGSGTSNSSSPPSKLSHSVSASTFKSNNSNENEIIYMGGGGDDEDDAYDNTNGMSAYAEIKPKQKRHTEPNRIVKDDGQMAYAQVLPKHKRKQQQQQRKKEEEEEGDYANATATQGGTQSIYENDDTNDPPDMDDIYANATAEDKLDSKAYATIDLANKRSNSSDGSPPKIPAKKGGERVKGYTDPEEIHLGQWLKSKASRDQAVVALKRTNYGPGSYCIRPDSSGTKKVLTILCEDGEASHFRFAETMKGGKKVFHCPDIPELGDLTFKDIPSCLQHIKEGDSLMLLSVNIGTCIPCPPNLRAT